MTLLAILGAVFTLLGFVGAVYALASIFLLEHFIRIPAAEPLDHFPPVTLLKPLHGDEPSLEPNLESFLRQDYPAPVQAIFGVNDGQDGAVAVVERLRARFPGKDIVLTVEEQRQGSNPKVSNLIAMQAAARNDILVLSDSDIAVASLYLREMVSALAPEDAGAVTCLYTGWAASGFASRLSAMGISYHFLPNVVTGVGLGMTQPCFGSTIAIKRSVLDAIGGFRAFASQLADDNEIGRAVRQLGHKVVIPAFAVRHACTEPTLRAWWDHELRWMRTIRTVDRAGHAGSIVTHGFPLALLGVICSGSGQLALAVALTTLLARAMLKWRIDKAFQGPAGPYWLLPVRDVLSFGVFVASLFGASVVWQDAQLRVRQDGALSNR
jgi:ceramide glucosyltransferase